MSPAASLAFLGSLAAVAPQEPVPVPALHTPLGLPERDLAAPSD